ncbi:hypothetical protein AA309_02965 [Microvirga vignae]|uniref:Uncharacterized protein n=1 Tax=Microvirga vignae TaxID=1225564 RepID=A0A0H1RH76_9HYPH|nr:hypothetical protein AA309_02965 [Microvirga vignae]
MTMIGAIDGRKAVADGTERAIGTMIKVNGADVPCATMTTIVQGAVPAFFSVVAIRSFESPVAIGTLRKPA